MRYCECLSLKLLLLSFLFFPNSGCANDSSSIEVGSIRAKEVPDVSEVTQSVSKVKLVKTSMNTEETVNDVIVQHNTETQREIHKLKNDKLALELEFVALKEREKQNKIDSLTNELSELKKELSLEDKKGIGFEVWLGLILASVTLIVTGLGVIIAVLAFFGYSNIKKAATIGAVKKSESLVQSAIKDGQFNEVIYSAVERAVYRDILSEKDFPEENEGNKS